MEALKYGPGHLPSFHCCSWRLNKRSGYCRCCKRKYRHQCCGICVFICLLVAGWNICYQGVHPLHTFCFFFPNPMFQSLSLDWMNSTLHVFGFEKWNGMGFSFSDSYVFLLITINNWDWRCMKKGIYFGTAYDHLM